MEANLTPEQTKEVKNQLIFTKKELEESRLKQQVVVQSNPRCTKDISFVPAKCGFYPQKQQVLFRLWLQPTLLQPLVFNYRIYSVPIAQFFVALGVFLIWLYEYQPINKPHNRINNELLCIFLA